MVCLLKSRKRSILFFQKQFNMKYTVDDIELKIEPEFRMLHNRVGVFNTHFQNFGHYNIPKAQLILADPPIISVLMLTQAIRLGTRMEITKMVKANLQVRSFSILTKISVLPSSCTFAHRCYDQSQKKKVKHLV